jgi:hypothetical protein
MQLLHPDPNLRPSAKKLRKDLLRRLFPADGIVNATGNVTMHKENEEEDKARKKKSNKAKAGRQQQLNHSSGNTIFRQRVL